jgi:hypothetical protein
MKRPFQIESHENYKVFIANEDLVIFLTSKLITCFIDGFTSDLISQSIVYLLGGREHTYWILGLEGEVHSIRASWTSNLHTCKGNLFLEFGWGMQ